MNKIEQNLIEMAREALGPVDLWPDIERRVRRRSWLARWMPASRLGWAAAVALVAVILSSAAYAAAPFLTDIYRINPNWNPDAASLSHPVGVTQTIADCTVTVDRVYVDEERILIEISVTGPERMSLAHTGARLALGDGLSLPWVDGAGHSELGEGTWVLSFDATPLAELPTELALTFSLSINAIPVQQGDSTAAASEAMGNDGVAVELEPIASTVYGPFDFSLRVPVSTADVP